EVALVLLVGGPGRTVGVLERAGYPGLQLCELRRGRRRMLDARLRELPAQRLPPVVGLLRGVPGVADAPLERLGVRTSGREAASLCRIEVVLGAAGRLLRLRDGGGETRRLLDQGGALDPRGVDGPPRRVGPQRGGPGRRGRGAR